LRCERVGDVLPRQPARLQRRGIEVDRDLARFAAEREGDRHAGDVDEWQAYGVEAEVHQVLLGQAVAGERELDDRHRRGIVVQDQRGRRVRRHLLEQGLRDGGDLRIGDADVDVGLEEDLDDRDAGIGIGLDMLDVVDGGRQRALERQRDAARHLVGLQARVLPDRADHRDANVREDVDRSAQRRQRPDDQDQQREHHERVRALQGDADDRNHAGNVLATSVSAAACAVLSTLVDSMQFHGTFARNKAPSWS
jgi:hypothetical protein